ncbi:T9SS type A sorting domain-containing protein [Hymenobacter rubidus]|uniref:T9SS type A sorting domain-containing protein n=1 Tax=Hymenobacter rubidus TaxID=1441626 RepID=UPI00191EAC18|nr:T9SS type A sorting domain-containing protein [Hymenobacter rubidus]
MRVFITLLILGLLFCRPAYAQGPNVDPSFINTGIYRPGGVVQAVRQPDGKTLLLGTFKRVLQQATGTLVRLMPNGTQLDTGFQANVAGLQGPVDHLALLPDGKLLLFDDRSFGTVGSSETLTLGSVTRQTLLRLNADGTPDASFNAQFTNSMTLQQVVPQPDGKLLLLGFFTPNAGQTGPVLIRLNADGSRDLGFQAPVFSINGIGTYPKSIALQPDGKVLATGNFDAVDGQPQQAVARLWPSGALDTSFTAAVPTDVSGRSVAVQPDGKLLLLCDGGLPSYPSVRRLLANGAVDSGFQYVGPSLFFMPGYVLPPVVQPDGRFLVATANAFYNGAFLGRLLRFLPTGTLDPAFNNAGALTGQINRPTVYPGSVQLLATGQLLVAAGRTSSALPRFPPLATFLPVGLAVLNADGSYDATFAPLIQDLGIVNDLALQPDGKIVLGGDFSEINGVAVRNLARLQANGLVDPSFSATTDGVVNTLALQTDGQVVVGGSFDFLSGVALPGLGRVLPTGALDAAFVPALAANTANESSEVRRLLVRSTGEVIISGTLIIQRGSTPAYLTLTQLQALTGQEDTGFQSTALNSISISHMLLQPSGKLVLAGNISSGPASNAPMWRLLPNGALDTSFPMPNLIADVGLTLAQDGAGRLYLSSQGRDAPGAAIFFRSLTRYLADGQPDPTFQAVLPGSAPTAVAIAVQPNGRVLLGGQLSSSSSSFNPNPEGTLRLLPTGAADPSYNPASGPVGTPGYSGNVNRLLIQPNGAILAAGYFSQVGTQSINGLVRLLDANVLSVRAQPATPATAAWPVPARGVLHLALEAAARPQRVELLDALGRPVLAQAVAQPDMSLNTASLPPGVYLLRVQYAQGGAVLRRVVLE